MTADSVIIDELIALDPNLASRRAALTEALRALQSVRSNDVIDPAFRARLRAELLERQGAADRTGFSPWLARCVLGLGTMTAGALAFMLYFRTPPLPPAEPLTDTAPMAVPATSAPSESVQKKAVVPVSSMAVVSSVPLDRGAAVSSIPAPAAAIESVQMFQAIEPAAGTMAMTSDADDRAKATADSIALRTAESAGSLRFTSGDGTVSFEYPTSSQVVVRHIDTGTEYRMQLSAGRTDALTVAVLQVPAETVIHEALASWPESTQQSVTVAGQTATEVRAAEGAATQWITVVPRAQGCVRIAVRAGTAAARRQAEQVMQSLRFQP